MASWFGDISIIFFFAGSTNSIDICPLFSLSHPAPVNASNLEQISDVLYKVISIELSMISFLTNIHRLGDRQSNMVEDQMRSWPSVRLKHSSLSEKIKQPRACACARHSVGALFWTLFSAFNFQLLTDGEALGLRPMQPVIHFKVKHPAQIGAPGLHAGSAAFKQPAIRPDVAAGPLHHTPVVAEQSLQHNSI